MFLFAYIDVALATRENGGSLGPALMVAAITIGGDEEKKVQAEADAPPPLSLHTAAITKVRIVGHLSARPGRTLPVPCARTTRRDVRSHVDKSNQRACRLGWWARRVQDGGLLGHLWAVALAMVACDVRPSDLIY